MLVFRQKARQIHPRLEDAVDKIYIPFAEFKCRFDNPSEKLNVYISLHVTMFKSCAYDIINDMEREGLVSTNKANALRIQVDEFNLDGTI